MSRKKERECLQNVFYVVAMILLIAIFVMQLNEQMTTDVSPIINVDVAPTENVNQRCQNVPYDGPDSDEIFTLCG